MFISPALADAGIDATAAAGPGLMEAVLPLLLVFAVFYIMIIRPQNKRIALHRKMISELNKGDKVVTGGGIRGTVKKLVGEEDVVLEIAHGVEITVLRHTLMSNSTAVAAATAEKDSSKAA